MDYLPILQYKQRPVVLGGAEGAMGPPDFGRSVNQTYLNQGEQIMPTTPLRAPPQFQTLRRLCNASLFVHKF